MDPWAGVDEPQLIARAQAGQAEAYGELVRRHQTRVYSAVLRLVGDRQDALDLSQEAFVRAYEAIGGFTPGRPFGPWIARVAANLTLNWLQRRRLPTVALEPDDREAPGAARSPPDYAYEPERAYLSAERESQIRAALAALPPHYRAVIELRHFQELPYETIAATLKIPLSDVKSHLFRARQQLRQLMKDEG